MPTARKPYICKALFNEKLIMWPCGRGSSLCEAAVTGRRGRIPQSLTASPGDDRLPAMWRHGGRTGPPRGCRANTRPPGHTARPTRTPGRLVTQPGPLEHQAVWSHRQTHTNRSHSQAHTNTRSPGHTARPTRTPGRLVTQPDPHEPVTQPGPHEHQVAWSHSQAHANRSHSQAHLSQAHTN